MDTPSSSQQITSLAEAKAYYLAKLAGVRKVSCYGRRVTIVFPEHATHLFSVESADPPPRAEAVHDGRQGVRRFSLERARGMDLVLPAISNYTVSIPGTGARGREKRMLHGPRLTDGVYMRVVLRPGPGTAWTCVSAYTVSEQVWLATRRAKRAKFPP